MICCWLLRRAASAAAVWVWATVTCDQMVRIGTWWWDCEKWINNKSGFHCVCWASAAATIQGRRKATTRQHRLTWICWKHSFTRWSWRSEQTAASCHSCNNGVLNALSFSRIALCAGRSATTLDLRPQSLVLSGNSQFVFACRRHFAQLKENTFDGVLRVSCPAAMPHINLILKTEHLETENYDIALHVQFNFGFIKRDKWNGSHHKLSEKCFFCSHKLRGWWTVRDIWNWGADGGPFSDVQIV